MSKRCGEIVTTFTANTERLDRGLKRVSAIMGLFEGKVLRCRPFSWQPPESIGGIDISVVAWAEKGKYYTIYDD